MPDRAPTGRPAPWQLDPAAVAADLDTFARLLAAKPEIAEKADILPFFRVHPHLAAFLGTYAYTASIIDRFAVEVGLFGQRTCGRWVKEVAGEGAHLAMVVAQPATEQLNTINIVGRVHQRELHRSYRASDSMA